MDYSYELGREQIFLPSSLYRDQVYYRDIEGIHYRQTFPEGHVLKTNGSADDYQAYGNFKIQGIGPVRLYLYNSQEEYIEIDRRGDKPIYFNLQDQGDLRIFYKELEKTWRAKR